MLYLRTDVETRNKLNNDDNKRDLPVERGKNIRY